MQDSYHLDRIMDFVGRDIGVSDWFTVDQGRIDFFGAATYDPDPQHDDPAWATAHSPYGHTIAYGFQTLSMLSHLTRAGNLQPGGTGFALNYGFDHVRFVSPVPVNSRIRCHVHLLEATEKTPSVFVLKTRNRVEIEGREKPALVADWLALCAAEGIDPAIL